MSLSSKPGNLFAKGFRQKFWHMSKDMAFDFSRMLFPVCCPVCHKALVKGESLLCLECMRKIPRTSYHLSDDNQLLHKLVDINAPIEKAASYFFYKNISPYSQLIRDAKYNGRPAINRELARSFARELRTSGFFDDIDLIMPVPIHWLKRLCRSYNQTDYIARGISEVSGLPIAYNLRASKSHTTQTHKTGKERRSASLDVFKVIEADYLKGRHILLVDDVITTGSTILSCARVLHQAVPGLRLSILSLAATRLGM